MNITGSPGNKKDPEVIISEPVRGRSQTADYGMKFQCSE